MNASLCIALRLPTGDVRDPARQRQHRPHPGERDGPVTSDGTADP